MNPLILLQTDGLMSGITSASVHSAALQLLQDNNYDNSHSINVGSSN